MNKNVLTFQIITTAENEKVMVAVWRDAEGLKVSAVEIDRMWLDLDGGVEVFAQAASKMSEGFLVGALTALADSKDD